MKTIKRIAAAVALSLGLGAAHAAEAGFPLDRFPAAKLDDQAALQNGAKLFVNYCLSCHSASSMRYNRLRDIGLSDEQVKANLLFAAEKVGEPMKIAMSPADAREWFGALPPDLSVIARARSSNAGSGADWLYTYLRTYYRDATRPTGWNNAVFESVGMPHALWQLQGNRGATIEQIKAVKDEKTGKLAGYAKTVVSFDASGARSESTTKLDGLKHDEARTITLGAPEGGLMAPSTVTEPVRPSKVSTRAARS